MKKLIRIILALAIGSTLIGCSSKPGGTIDLTSHIKVSIKGFNGKGEVYIDNNTKYDKTNSDIRDFVADIEYTLENGTMVLFLMVMKLLLKRNILNLRQKI